MLTQVETSRLTKPNGNGHASAAEVLEDALGLPRPASLWQRLFRWEANLTVAGKVIEKGWVVPQPLGVALIVVMLGVVGWAYTSNTKDTRETREAIIEMKTMLNERTQTFKEQQAEFKLQLETEKRVAELQREKQNEEIRDMKAALNQKRNRQ